MIIRTITIFTKDKDYNSHLTTLQNIKTELESNNHIVQTTRISTNYLESLTLEELNLLNLNGEVMFNLGTLDIKDSPKVEIIPELLLKNKSANASVYLSKTDLEISQDSAIEAAKLFKNLVKTDYNSTFRFGLNCNVNIEIPFYPISYAISDQSSIGLGLQLSTRIIELINQNHTLNEIKETINAELKEIENLIMNLCQKNGYNYVGIDTSLAPLIDDNVGIIYEKLFNVSIGDLGTLNATAQITSLLKSFEIKKTGYCGVMLAIMEDSYLARKYSEGKLDLQKLMLYSTVCACGLDTVPISDEVSVEDIANIYLDVTRLSFRHNKPLCVRLLSIPNSKSGEYTKFESPYLVNARMI